MFIDLKIGLLSINWAKTGIWSNKLQDGIEMSHICSLIVSTKNNLKALSIIIGPINIKFGLYV